MMLFKELLVVLGLTALAVAQFRGPFGGRFGGGFPRGGRFFGRQPPPPRPNFGQRPSSFRGPPAPQPTRGSGQIETYQGKQYLITWRGGPSNLDWNSARSYCASQGMKMISLDTPAKSQYFLGLVGRENAEYFWAGGRISGSTLIWENGRSEGISKGRGFWSTEGQIGAQPEGNGDCLAVLNNVYNDGVRWHDVACHHRKPTICEQA